MPDLIPLLFAWLLFAMCSQGEEWDQRFYTVRRDLNKWSSSKTIFPHLSPARRFICLVICNSVNRLTEATDEGKHREQSSGVTSGVREACWEVMEQPGLLRIYWMDRLGLTFHSFISSSFGEYTWTMLFHKWMHYGHAKFRIRKKYFKEWSYF